MKKRKKLFYAIIILIGIFCLFSLNYINSQSTQSSDPRSVLQNASLKKQYEDALKSLREKPEDFSYFNNFLELDKGVQELIIQDNLKDLLPALKKFSAEDRALIINKYPYAFQQGFKNLIKIAKDDKNPKSGVELGAELFMDKDSNGALMLDDATKNTLWKSLEKNEAEALLQVIGDKYVSSFGLFNDKTEPHINLASINDPNKKLKWKGTTLVGEKGGYIDFDKDSKTRMGKWIKQINYNQGEFSLRTIYNTEILFSEGTLNSEGYLVSPDGKEVGKSRELDITGGKVPEGKISKRKVVYNYEDVYDESGNLVDFRLQGTEIHLEGDIERTFLTCKDVNGNTLWFGLNPDNQEADGTIAERYRAVIRIGDYTTEDGKILSDIISVRSAKIFKYGYGEDIFSNKGFTYLLGNYFNSPNAKISEQTFEQYMTSKTLEKAKELAGEASGQVGTAVSDYLREKYNSEVPLPFGKLKVKLGTLESAKLVGELLVMPKEAVKDIIAGTAETSIVAGRETSKQVSQIKQNMPEIIKSVLSDRATYQEFDRTGENYYYFNIEPSVSSAKMYTELRIGGDQYVHSDISQFFGGEIDKIVVNNRGVNGENVYIQNGNFQIGFEGSQLTYNRNLVGSSNVEIGSIVNQQDKAMIQTPWSLSKDNGGAYHLSPANTARTDVITGANQYIAGPFASYHIGGVQIQNAPLNPDAYAGNNPDYYASFELDPQIVSERRLGRRIRRNRVLPQMEEKASIGTNEIASELSENIRAGFQAEITKAGGIEAFETQMRSLDNIISIYGKDEFSRLVKSGESPIPGFTVRELYAREVWNKINSGEFDRSMSALAQAGTVRPGVSLKLTSTQGAVFNGQQIQGFDPIIANFIASEMSTRRIPDKPTLSLRQAQSKGGDTGVQPINVQQYFSGLKGKTIAEQSSQVIQSTATQNTGTQSQSTGCWSCNQRTCTPSGCN